MVCAHCGLAVCALGIVWVSSFSAEQDVRMQIADRVSVGPYHVQMASVSPLQGPNYAGMQGKFLVSHHGVSHAVFPQKRIYLVRQMPMARAGIDKRLFADLYIAMGDELPHGAWSVRIYYKPLVRLIWMGGLLMAFGGLLAFIAKFNRKEKGKSC